MLTGCVVPAKALMTVEGAPSPSPTMLSPPIVSFSPMALSSSTTMSGCSGDASALIPSSHDHGHGQIYGQG